MLALKASCCIPVIFRPQIMNGNVYVDGGAITNTLSKIILKEHQPNTLSINIVYNNTKISPHNLENLSPIEFMYRLHKNACYFEHKHSMKPNELDLYHSLSSGVTDPTTEDQDEMIRTGQLLTHNFLSKRGY
jgi:predicted acylesterase/phospholipase RssA